MRKTAMPDWMTRALKTFVQTFFGVVIPELCVLLNGGFPANWPALWTYLSPVIAAALAAAISAAWNIIIEMTRDE